MVLRRVGHDCVTFTSLPFWYWNCSCNSLATWCKEPIYWKRPWFWDRLKAGGERDDRGWDCFMASLTQWTWDWTYSRRQWRIERPVKPQFMGSQSQKILNDWTTTAGGEISTNVSTNLITDEINQFLEDQNTKTYTRSKYSKYALIH